MKKLSVILSQLALFLTPGVALAGDYTLGGGDTPLTQIGDRAAADPGTIIAQIIYFIFVVAVILALGFLVYGGIKWLTSGGDKDAVAAARGTIIAAIVGLIIIFLAYLILNFIVYFLTGSYLQGIEIPNLTG